MSTMRAVTRAAIKTVAQAYQTANPTKLRAVYSARPAGVSETPYAYVTMAETLTFPGAIWTRTLRPALVVVENQADPDEHAERMDELVDALLTAYADAPHAAGNTRLLQPTGVEDVEDQVGTVSYPGFAITFEALEIPGDRGT